MCNSAFNYKFKDSLKEEKGQAIVELAIVLPIILLIIMIIVYLGIFTFTKCVVLLSAHEGGREALLIWNNKDMTQEEKETEIREAVASGLAGLPAGEDSDIVVLDDHAGNIQITARYYYTLNLPFLGALADSDAITIESTVAYRYATAPE